MATMRLVFIYCRRRRRLVYDKSLARSMTHRANGFILRTLCTKSARRRRRRRQCIN